MSKTLLISEIFPPIHGGSGRWFWELYSRLPRDEYLIVAGESAETTEFDKTHDLNINRINLTSPSWGIRSKSGLAFYWRTFWQLKKLIKQHNITRIHCGRCLPEGVMGWLLSIFTGISFICYVHGEDVETASTSRELSWLVRKVLNRASTLISNSKNTANILINNWSANSDKVVVLNPGCDTNRFVPAEHNQKIKNSLEWGENKVILTVGRLQKRKGHDVMIAALPAIKEHIPDILYAIVGNGEEKESLQALVTSLGLEENVLFHAEINDKQMIQCYQQCDVFVLPNRTEGNDIEGFGMVLVEAQSCAKPVIAGDSGGTKETMIIGETGFIVDCTQPKNIADRITELLQSPEKCAQLGAAGRVHVVKTLDWKVHTEKALTLFKQY
jgi:phosphatidylinositol alpha-1,6-mannosyltransferase